jgi:hypothetical protein
MPFGLDRPVEPINAGDSAELYANLRIDGQPIDASEIASVVFTIQSPQTETKFSDSGLVLDDGSGFYRFAGTTETGVWLVQAQFTLNSGLRRSVMLNFNVVDPFADAPEPTYVEEITSGVMLRLEDLFDSVDGGPWLRDKTLRNFDENKIADFIPQALMDINIQMPASQLIIDTFTAPMTDGSGNRIPNPNIPLLIQGTLVRTMEHLARSYIEQPVPQGAQVVWSDRTRYQQAWQQAAQYEKQDFVQNVRLWKRHLYGFGQSSLSVFSWGGRMFPYGGTNQAARGVFRGYY